ncbi:hypothetical protein EW145_g3021 [Phellinidium pouzarii]|uniref:Squalene monooxygenase n=1 Tax=Phellinidium pouzarii TaxID=167371 RepID=A0A4S4L920_9AGAM|nr:hypothetical protein EW145_g3021 [Phellinidium pouzarii]
MANSDNTYDIIIVGAGIAGCALAHGLATITSAARPRPLKIALLERSLVEPDRIVGELLQPGGCAALRKLGMSDCLENIGAIPVRGYCVVNEGKQVHIPYPDGLEGRSFHHGRFIQSLRAKAAKATGVDVIEATVAELIIADGTNRVHGVRATRKGKEVKENFYGALVLISDGCFSNFRAEVMGEAFQKPLTRSHFVGAILKDVQLPIDKHGTVALVKGSGPVLMYQIGDHDTRILIDVKTPLPSDLKEYILDKVVPELPSNLQPAIKDALELERLRRMPNSFLPPVEQGEGGMTVAFNDVVILTDLLRSVQDLDDWECISQILHAWHWSRKPLGSTINILSIALYDLFGAEDEDLDVLRVGCFNWVCLFALFAFYSVPTLTIVVIPTRISPFRQHLIPPGPSLPAFLRGRLLLDLGHVHAPTPDHVRRETRTRTPAPRRVPLARRAQCAGVLDGLRCLWSPALE